MMKEDEIIILSYNILNYFYSFKFGFCDLFKAPFEFVSIINYCILSGIQTNDKIIILLDDKLSSNLPYYTM